MSNNGVVAIIRPKGINHLNNAITLPGSYEVNGDIRSRSRNGSIHRKVLKQSPGDLRFDRTRTEHRILSAGREENEVKAEIEFFKNHTVVVEDVNGVKKENALFTIEVLSDTKEKSKKKTTNVNSIISAVYGMSEEDRANVMYFFKEDPRKLDDDDIKLFLVSVDNGILLNDTPAGPGKKSNSEVFLENFVSAKGKAVSERVKVMTYVNKGIVTNEVQERDGKFYIGDTLIGKEADDIVLFFRDNPQFFDNLVKSLSKAGDDTAKKDEGKIESSTTVNDVPEAIKLRFEKKHAEYKLKGAMPKSFDKLKEKVWNFEDGEDMERTPED